MKAVEETAAETPLPETEADISRAVDNLVKSKKLAVTGIVGKASIFDIKTHSALDYTVGGKLSTRWCNDNDANIQAKRLMGFIFPEEISPRLKNLSRGGQVLMLRHIEAKNEHVAALERDNAAWEGKTFNRNEKAKAQGLEGFKIERADRR